MIAVGGNESVLHESFRALVAAYLGCDGDELGDEWQRWVAEVVECTAARRIDYAAIGRLSHAAVQIAGL